MLGMENGLAACLVVGNIALVMSVACASVLTRILEFVILCKLASHLKKHHKQYWVYLGFDLNKRPSVSTILDRRRKWFALHGDPPDPLVDMMKEKKIRLGRLANSFLVLLLASILLFASTVLALVKFGMLHVGVVH